MLITVIIPHLRGREILLDTLTDLAQERKSLLADGVALEVLVVDNASRDGSVKAAERAHPWIHVLRLARNHGFAGGCNRGIQASNGEWVWLLNDDVRLEPGVVTAMLSVAASDSDVAAVQPKILSAADPAMFDYAGGAGGLIDRFGYPFAYGRIGGVMEADHGQYDEPREIFWASGTACLWKRTALQQIGLLDEDFFAHMEEIDLAWRAHLAGWRIVSAPAGSVSHRGGSTLSYQAWGKMYLNHRNGLITLAKNADGFELPLLLVARMFMDLAVGLAETVSGRVGRLTAVLAGWRDFLRTISRTLEKRRQVKRLRLPGGRVFANVVYPGSILFAYARGVRRACELVARGDRDA
ncbi:MAG: N-acetylglucosaminyl-diphospho-decaprenol L-rhamnosyltransferase [Calditrichaeota bacterium]|nr:N-acetylglucosaminyl-diphospho-decaprenol L-rhamnosyltransferase [Calditrichota bacterium]